MYLFIFRNVKCEAFHEKLDNTDLPSTSQQNVVESSNESTENQECYS